MNITTGDLFPQDRRKRKSSKKNISEAELSTQPKYPLKYTVLNPVVEFHESLRAMKDMPHMPKSMNKIIQYCCIQHQKLKADIQHYEKFQSKIKDNYEKALKEKQQRIEQLEADLKIAVEFKKLHKKYEST